MYITKKKKRGGRQVTNVSISFLSLLLLLLSRTPPPSSSSCIIDNNNNSQASCYRPGIQSTCTRSEHTCSPQSRRQRGHRSCSLWSICEPKREVVVVFGKKEINPIAREGGRERGVISIPPRENLKPGWYIHRNSLNFDSSIIINSPTTRLLLFLSSEFTSRASA